MTVGLAVGLVSADAAMAERNPLPPYLHHSSFEQIAQRRGVSVYKHRTSRIIRVGAEARFPAPPERVRRALLDYRRQLGRIDRLSEARVLRRQDGELQVYQRLNLPVISDRDFTLRVRHGNDGSSHWVAYSAVRDAGPAPRDGIVRVVHHRGSWHLQPVDGGRSTRVSYQVTIDLGGWLPLWMARAGAGRELPELFASICQLSQPDPQAGSCP